jgi:hypothetical protein
MSSTDNLLENAKRPDDISVRGLLLKAKEYLLLLIRRWWLITVFAFLFGGQSFYSVRQVKPVYPGEITLLVNTKNTAKENKNRVLVFSRFLTSRKAIEKILLEPVDSLGSDLLINKYLHVYFQYKPEGLSEDIPVDFLFTHNTQADFTDIEAVVFKEIVSKISTYEAGYADGFVTVSLEETLGLITFGIATPDADLTMMIIEKLNLHFQDLIFTYSSFAETNAYNNLKANSDTLEMQYRRVTSRLSKAKNNYQFILDKNKNTVNSETLFRGEEIEYLQGEAELYKAKYLENLKQLKIAQSAMNMTRPIVEVIKQTLPPLEYYKPSALRAALKFGMVGAFLMIVLIILHKVFMDILEEGK